MSKSINLLLIGFGPHAQKCFYPVFEKYGKAWGFCISCIVDLEPKREKVEKYLTDSLYDTHTLFIDPKQINNQHLTRFVENKLDLMVREYNINGVIIASEPTSHFSYAEWALNRGLNILLDKPISTRKDASTLIKEAKGILDDYERLFVLYKNTKVKHPKLIFSILSQRRYHNGILKIKELIQEVFQRTNCPITATQANHSDGQWRTPNEIINIDYHGFNFGFGKCSHSGYHFFDTVSSLISATEKKELNIDNVDVIASFIRPPDLLSQFDYKDYSKIFPDFLNDGNYSENSYLDITQNFGEIDAFVSLVFKHGSKALTLGSINLLHNSFSQRGWLSSVGRELYKGNGRIGHESYQINQGPFQTIYYTAYKGDNNNPFETGGEYHLEIQVFRNNYMFPDWENYHCYAGEELALGFPKNDFPGAQEGARRKCIKEFVDFIHGKVAREDLKSDFVSHKRPVTLMSASYQSAANGFRGKNRLINIPFYE